MITLLHSLSYIGFYLNRLEISPLVLLSDNIPYEKAGDTLTPLEVPFDIPDSWEWIKPTDIGYFSSGKTPRPDELAKDGIVPYFKVAEMNVPGNELYLQFTEDFLIAPERFKLFHRNTIAYPKNGGAVFTNKKRILVKDSLVDLNTGTYTPFSPIDSKFFYYLFSTVDFRKYYKGTALPTVDTDAVQKTVWGLPPLDEQKRIVATIETVMPFIDKYAAKEKQLALLNTSFPQDLKKSILQQAVQGKLVPQDPADEPAEALLERIRAEKQRLTKEGKIKKDKHESVIFRRDNSHYELVDGVERCIDEELPFEIPQNWAWAHFTNVIEIITNLVPPDTFGNYKHIAPDNIEKSTGRLLECKTVKEDKVISANHLVSEGCIIYSKIRPLLRKAIIAPFDCLCSADMYPLETTLDKYYVMYFLLSDSFNLQVASIASSRIKMPKINQKELSATVIPIPPLSEQHRIVKKTQELLSICE